MKILFTGIGRLQRVFHTAILIFFFLAACQVQNNLATPTLISPQFGQGGIIGRLDPFPQEWSGKVIFAFAAPYLGPADGEGIFVLDEMLHPKGTLDDHGWFQINSVPPGSYVLVFGPNTEEAIVFRENSRATRFEVVPDELIDVGSLLINP